MKLAVSNWVIIHIENEIDKDERRGSPLIIPRFDENEGDQRYDEFENSQRVFLEKEGQEVNQEEHILYEEFRGEQDGQQQQEVKVLFLELLFRIKKMELGQRKDNQRQRKYCPSQQ
ncbi:hypothetical protein FGO68_gene11664 [Halteria grandinella]|uniref:Uncharacterized protein n=1 Tax=Halteria grandinella TaxID=5974 RepID=A0A8J8SU04_HALGN|nr:hypothetical protein FGO68_gene11664 [Halteria grandinella]